MVIESILQIALSPIDEERFGIRTARASSVTAERVPTALDFCHRNDVVLLIARCSTMQVRALQAMEREGFILMDTLMHYTRDLLATPIPPAPANVLVRRIRDGEEEAIAAVAVEAFRGYPGHYHADERLDQTKCDQVYVSWTVRCCTSPEVADEVLVAELDQSIVGFQSVQIRGADEEVGGLGGVAPAARGRGVARALEIARMVWARSKGAKRVVARTGIRNIGMQKVFHRLGFEPECAEYTFHKWFT